MNLTGEKKYQLLVEISQKIRDTLDLDEIMEHMLDTIKTVLDYDAAGIFVLNQDLVHGRHEQSGDLIAGMIQRGYEPQPMDRDAMFTEGKGIIGQVIFSRSSVVAPDVRQNPYYLAGRDQTMSEIAVPIVRNNRAIGALNLESDRLAAYDESDKEVLEFFADAAAIALEKAMLHRQILEKELIDKQLQLARDVQFRLFPGGPPSIPGYDIDGICIPAEEVGGDYYDYVRLPRGALAVAVADVSGHGVAAALVMTAFRGLLRMHTRSKLGPGKIARTINRLLPDFTGNSQFITAALLVLDLQTDKFTYTSCGHQPPLLIQEDGGFRPLDLHGPALGILKKADYPCERLPLIQGDILVLYTDGVLDLTNAADEAFGMERLRAALTGSRHLPASAMIKAVIQSTREFSGTKSFPDDFTLVIIKRRLSSDGSGT